ncbi:MAG TPA: hypothetical protein VJ779_00725 [Acetobacteraceae bacterium]|jgi:hypothetical protein|nr:hypothetical protein [Acetobacteraceae bacterium]
MSRFEPAGIGKGIYREEWNLGVVEQPAEDIVRRGIVTQVRWLPALRPWKMLADPWCHGLPDGRLVILAERLDYRIGRGEIWAAVIRAGEDITRATFVPWMRAACHLSYPVLGRDEGGRLFLLVESWEAQGLYLWRERPGLPGRLHGPVGPLVPGPAIDATIWRGEDRWWLFCTFKDDAPNARLHLFHAEELEGPWTAHAGNPVKDDITSSRPAGPLFWCDGQLIRPAQDCSETYGGGVTLNAITRLDREGFSETKLRVLQPVDQEYPHGLHTLSPAGDVTIIDGKRWAAQALDIPRRLVVGVGGKLRQRMPARLPKVLPPLGG